ncbi:MAG: tetratricopeptide repeat protein [Anaerolineales bacterium]|nr:tetratricopeptide repeat protein [Anaerolineales bacterium]
MTRLKIFCFGTFQASLDDIPLTFFTDKARALLAYLALQSDHPQRRQRLAGLFWSDMPEERALHNLRQTLSLLRKSLQDDLNPVPVLLVEREAVQFNPQYQAWLDVTAFEQGIQAALRHYQHCPGDNPLKCRLNLRQLEQATAFFRGPFLDQFYLSGSPLFDEWASLEREAYNQRAMEALTILAEIYERRGEYARARQYTSQLVALAPWDEAARVQVMRLLAMEGQWSAAQQQYRNLRRDLRQQMGVEPAPDTEALFTIIRRAASQTSALPARREPARHNLLPSLTAFVGREKELDTLATALADPYCRLLTLHGPGGVGKTRLALQVAEEQRGIFREGVFFIPLGAVPAADLLPTAIAEALGYAFYGTEALAEQLLRWLEAKHMLLVLDNLEQLLPWQPGDLIPQILQRAPGIVILATSRQRLNLQEEHLFPVEGLSYPANPTADDLAAQEAVQLFIQCARRIQPGFSLETTANREAVVEICQLLDGLPLGIELAAATLWRQNPAGIVANLKGSLGILAAEVINVQGPHRSLWAAIEISWALLTLQEQHLLAALTVFKGGFETGMVTPVLSATKIELSDLLDKSILRRRPTGRYEWHEAVRQFAAEQLALDANRHMAAQAAHAQVFVSFLQARLPALKTSQQTQALTEIALEWENIRQAWEWLASQRKVAGLAECAEALFHFCTIRTRYQEGIELFGRAIRELEGHPAVLARLLTYQGALAFRVQGNELCEQALVRALEIFDASNLPGDQALCLIYASGLAFRRKNPALARQRCDQALALFEQSGDAWGQSYALYQLGLLESRAGHVPEAQQAFLSSLELARAIGDQRRQIGPLNLLGDLACKVGQYARAQEYFEAALDLSRILDDRFNIAQALINLGTAYHYAEQYDQARAHYLDSLAVAREIGDLANQSLALINLGELALASGQLSESRDYLQQALAVAHKEGDEWAALVCWIHLAEVAVGQQDIPAARQYLAKALPLAQESGEPALLLRALLQLGRLYLLQGQREQAVNLLGLVIHHQATYDEHRQAALEALQQAGLAVPAENRIDLEAAAQAQIARIG